MRNRHSIFCKVFFTSIGALFLLAPHYSFAADSDLELRRFSNGCGVYINREIAGFFDLDKSTWRGTCIEGLAEGLATIEYKYRNAFLLLRSNYHNGRPAGYVQFIYWSANPDKQVTTWLFVDEDRATYFDNIYHGLGLVAEDKFLTSPQVLLPKSTPSLPTNSGEINKSLTERQDIINFIQSSRTRVGAKLELISVTLRNSGITQSPEAQIQHSNVQLEQFKKEMRQQVNQDQREAREQQKVEAEQQRLTAIAEEERRQRIAKDAEEAREILTRHLPAIIDNLANAGDRQARQAPPATPPNQSAGITIQATQQQATGSVSATTTGSGSQPAMQCLAVTPAENNGWYLMKNTCNYVISVSWCYAGTSDCKNGDWGYTNTGNISAGGTRKASTFTGRVERKGLVYAACSGRDVYIKETGPKSFICK